MIISAQIKCNGRRLNPKAVVSAMPVVMARARAQIILFMASPFLLCLRLPEQGNDIRDRHHVLAPFFQKAQAAGFDPEIRLSFDVEP
jgi:hypothetical protein